MSDFWEDIFKEKQTMWGFEPAESAIRAKDFFMEKKCRDILIPGIGYGRNAKIFLENGMDVTGIEISETAIDLARTQNKLDIPIYHGSITEMPFDGKLYDGIFSYALIHLFGHRERKKFISDCYSQIKSGGYMIFSTISKKDSLYEKGKLVSKDRFEVKGGAKLFFYDAESIRKEFEKYGLVDFFEIDEPVKFSKDFPPMKFTIIKCKKNKINTCNTNNMNTKKKNLMELFQEESPEIAQAFGGLIQAVSNMKALEPKMKQLIYIAIRASQGETTAVTAHVPMAKKAGATRDELKEAILMTTTVCGIKGVASCLAPALEAYDNN